MTRFCASGEGRYILAAPELGVEFDVDRLRRERQQLIGELTVRCTLPGASTFNSVLSIADFNLSSDRERYFRVRTCATKAKTEDIDWAALLEELCQRVLAAERKGQPAVLLRDVSRPSTADQLDIEGLTLQDRHPVILFGDGGAAKSYTGLYLAGRLEARGLRMLYADWEFAAEDHRDQASAASAESHSVTSPRSINACSYAGQVPTRYLFLYFGWTCDLMSRSCTGSGHNGQRTCRCRVRPIGCAPTPSHVRRVSGETPSRARARR